MKIGYDGKRAVSNMTGLGNYSRLVIESIGATYPGCDLRVYTPRLAENERLAKILGMDNVKMELPRTGWRRAGGTAWRTMGMGHQAAGDGVEIFHGLSNELPWNIASAGVPSVVTMHDVIYRTRPQFYKPADRLLYDVKYGHSCRVADRIIAVSECTKRDVVECYGVDPGKVDVVYQGCDPAFRDGWRLHMSKEAEACVPRVYLEGSRRYLLQVGSIEARKNAMQSVRALKWTKPDLDLILVGRSTPYLRKVLDEASALGVRGRVHVMQDVPMRQLPALYANAFLSLYPSEYEGFGIPVLESLSCGVPCVATTGSCLEEAGGEGALYCGIGDAEGLASAINRLDNDRGLYAHLSDCGLRHAALFDVGDLAGRVMEVYERTLAGYRGKNKKIKKRGALRGR